MSDVAHLINAVNANQPEDTPLAMLADALDEAHPLDNDGRAMLLKKWLREPENRLTGVEWYARPQRAGAFLLHRDQEHPLQHAMAVMDDGSVWATFGGVPGGSFGKRVELTHTEARDVADHLPNSTETHEFLNNHLGPDPRPLEARNRYARSYGDAISE